MIVPISVCYYLELGTAIMFYLGVQFLLKKIQYVGETL